MRYHKAIEITKVEADSLIANSRTSRSGVGVVMSCDRWYDVRDLTVAELDAFAADLARAEFAADAAAAALPH
jgi:hypothetical protein